MEEKRKSREGRWWVRYLVPVVGVVGVVGARLVMDRWIKVEAPFLLFLGTVVGAAWYGGWGPGVVTVALATAASGFFFVEPVRRFAVANPSDWVQLGLFVIEGLVACVLCGSLHAARRRSEAEADRSRQLEGAVLEISDAEQRRIGQDLHDGLGQHLTGVAFLAKALGRRVEAESPGAAGEADRVARLVSEAIGRARDVARGLSPVGLETGGLRPAMEHLAEGVESMLGMRCTLEWDEAVVVADGAVALHLYRIAQESVGNAARHGKAKETIVRVRRVGDGAGELSVSDDGTGIARQRPGGAGMGLQIMTYRARMIGGRLEVSAGKRGGTVVRCTFPVRASVPGEGEGL